MDEIHMTSKEIIAKLIARPSGELSRTFGNIVHINYRLPGPDMDWYIGRHIGDSVHALQEAANDYGAVYDVFVTGYPYEITFREDV